jgi:hypothetical protein
MTDIIWKIIDDYDNYSVSNTGDIKNNITNRILKYNIRNGYKALSLCKNNTKKTTYIHSVVANHFLEKPNYDKYVINHIDEDKLNNNLNNLEFTTYRYNTMYSMSSNRSINSNTFDLNNFIDIPNHNQYMISKNGEIYSKNIKRLCCYVVHDSGYHRIKLKTDMNNYKDYYIHVLVAISYMNYVPNGNQYVINHIDGNKGNNKLTNLEIVTQKQNMRHSVIMNYDKIYRRAVYYIDNDNNIIEFKSAKEASIYTNIDNSSILKSCKSDSLKAGNIKWYFKSNS